MIDAFVLRALTDPPPDVVKVIDDVWLLAVVAAHVAVTVNAPAVRLPPAHNSISDIDFGGPARPVPPPHAAVTTAPTRLKSAANAVAERMLTCLTSGPSLKHIDYAGAGAPAATGLTTTWSDIGVKLG